MKNGRNWKSFAMGMATMALLCTLVVPVLAAGNMQTISAMIGGIRIVIDGQELHPTDVNGNPVNPMIYNGTTYLPVRAVASALGKAVYWDGPNSTVYLGDMDGQLEYPTVMLKDMTSVADSPESAPASKLKDNYGNSYSSAVYNLHGHCDLEYLLGMKYSSFKGVLYVPNGYTYDGSLAMTITVDGHQVYTSPAMDKASSPIQVDVNVTGGNSFKISFTDSAGNSYGMGWPCIALADAGFYQ